MGGIFITNANMATSTSKTFLELLIQGAELMSVQLWTPACPLQLMEGETLLGNGFHTGEGDWACLDDAINSFFLHCVNHKADNNIAQTLNKVSFRMY